VTVEEDNIEYFLSVLIVQEYLIESQASVCSHCSALKRLSQFNFLFENDLEI
jgi:hypothetical protein